MADFVKNELARLYKVQKAQEVARAAQAAAAKKAKEAAAWDRRISRQPPEAENEGEASKFIRAHFEWEPHPELWVPPYSSYSDYSGSMAERANAEFWKDNFPEYFKLEPGGYGTIWAGIPDEKRIALDNDPEAFEQIKSAVESLEDYSVLDEERLSQLEMEQQWEDWKQSYREDMRKAMSKHATDPEAKLAAMFITDEEMDKAYSEQEWYNHHEMEGVSSYFRAEQAAEEVDDEWLIDAAGKRVEEAKKIAFATDGLRARFENAVQARWGATDPRLVELVLDQSDENALHLLDGLVRRIGDPGCYWDVEETGDDAYVELCDEVLKMAVDNLKGREDVQAFAPESPDQLKFKFEGYAIQLVSALLEDESAKDFLRRYGTGIKLADTRWKRITLRGARNFLEQYAASEDPVTAARAAVLLDRLRKASRWHQIETIIHEFAQQDWVDYLGKLLDRERRK